MKKHLILALAAFSVNLFAQNSFQVKHIENSNAVMSNGSHIYETTAASHNTHLNLDIVNTSTNINTYNAKRTDILLNTDAVAYFCFGGQCYDNTTFVSPNSITLGPGQAASAATGSYNVLTADLDEGPLEGTSIVKYTFYNTANTSDSVQVTINYNIGGPVGIKETSKSLSAFEIFPNPAKENASLLITSPKASVSSLILFNSIGEAVYKKEVSLNEGKNKVDINLQNLASGVYFASLKTGDATLSKKLIIN